MPRYMIVILWIFMLCSSVPPEAIRASGVDLVGTLCLFFYAVPTELKTGETLFL